MGGGVTPPAPESPPAPVELACIVAGVCVLVVDDEPAIVRALGRLLRRHGHDLRTAGSAAEALRVLEEFTPAVVISDFKMDGLNGLELLRIVADRVPGARRILLSGYAEGVDDPSITFLTKPYDAQALLALVAQGAG